MIVWPKMLGGDDEKAARKTSKMFDDPRVHHFYDHNRLIGTKYAKTIFKNFGKDALTSLPKDHKISQLCGMLEQVAKNPPEKVPAWDVIFFYKSGSKWKETVPQPIGWSKQIAFLGATGDGEGHTGYFWANSFKNPLRKSDWYDEVRNQLKQLSKSSKK